MRYYPKNCDYYLYCTYQMTPKYISTRTSWYYAQKANLRSMGLAYKNNSWCHIFLHLENLYDHFLSPIFTQISVIKGKSVALMLPLCAGSGKGLFHTDMYDEFLKSFILCTTELSSQHNALDFYFQGREFLTWFTSNIQWG